MVSQGLKLYSTGPQLRTKAGAISVILDKQGHNASQSNTLKMVYFLQSKVCQILQPSEFIKKLSAHNVISYAVFFKIKPCVAQYKYLSFKKIKRYFLSTTKITCRSWDPLSLNEDTVDSTLRVPTKDLNNHLILNAPIKPIQLFRSFTRQFIVYLLIEQNRHIIPMCAQHQDKIL
jgi:hypothetical protein